jgi:hypothetical protein
MCLSAKGVGSQGDGSIQVLCSSVDQQNEVDFFYSITNFIIFFI